MHGDGPNKIVVCERLSLVVEAEKKEKERKKTSVTRLGGTTLMRVEVAASRIDMSDGFSDSG